MATKKSDTEQQHWILVRAMFASLSGVDWRASDQNVNFFVEQLETLNRLRKEKGGQELL